MDTSVILPACPERFPALVRVVESGSPTIAVGEGDYFALALDPYVYLADHPNVEAAFTSEEAKAKLKALEAAK